MCGEHEKILLYGDAIPGSSPHVRGALWFSEFFVYSDGIIPACAGSTLHDATHGVTAGGSSPHVRGARDC